LKDEIAIEIKNISAGYDNDIVIENINCNIYEGDFFGIIGPNGGGKSTLLKIILGLLNPIKGSIKIYGKSPKIARKNIGYVPQYSEFDKHYPISVWDIVLMGRRSIRGLNPIYSNEDKKATIDALKKVNMLKYKKRHISELSGGQRQRVFIARALVSNPKILLLDEPTASIDKDLQINFYNLLKELNKNVTILLVTHDIGVISSYVNRVACLNHFMFTHDDEKMISKEMLEKTYSCPVELIAHGVPHRVLDEHKKNNKKR
jgi:zinc transport system ATP-binding protein